MEIKDGKDYLPQVRALLLDYTRQLNRDLSFQNIDAELQDPAKKYTPPEGELLVALTGETALGMVAYHRHTPKRCEMKRLYVKPEARGLHLGDALVREILLHAKRAGYCEMVLDTVEPLQAAIGLYEKHGFQRCAPYYENPMPDVIYMKKALL